MIEVSWLTLFVVMTPALFGAFVFGAWCGYKDAVNARRPVVADDLRDTELAGYGLPAVEVSELTGRKSK